MDANTGEGKPVIITITVNDEDMANNYDITPQAMPTATISKVSLEINGITAENKSYDGNNIATIYDPNNGKLSTGIRDEVIEYTVAGTFDGVNAADNKTVTLNIVITTVDVAKNYEITLQKTTAANITKATLELPEIEKIYTYNGSGQIPDELAKIMGVAGQELTNGSDYSLSFNTTNSGNIGDELPVNAGGYTITVTLTGTAANNYELAHNTVSFDIEKYGLKVTYNGDKEYTGKVQDLRTVLTLEGLNGELTYDADYELGNADVPALAIKNVGAYTLLINLLNDISTNYTVKDSDFISDYKFTFRIIPVALELPVITESYTYNGKEHEPTELEDDIQGVGEILYKDSHYTLSYSTVNGSLNDSGIPVGAGEYTVTVILTGLAANNYELANNTVSFTIEKYGLKVTYNGDKEYTGKDQDLSTVLTLEGLNGELTYGKDYELCNTDVLAPAIKKVGAYTLLIDLLNDISTNYTVKDSDFISDYKFTFSIIPVALELPVITESYTYSGLAQTPKELEVIKGASETLYNSFNYTLSYSTVNGSLNDSGIPVGAGEYTVTVTLTGFAADNYKLAQNTVSFTIKKAAVTIGGIIAISKPYDGEIFSEILDVQTARERGLIIEASNGEISASFSIKISTKSANASANAYTLAAKTVEVEYSEDNYEVIFDSATISVTINPLEVTVTISNLEYVYDGYDHKANILFNSRLVDLADYTVTYNGNEEVPHNAGNYAVAVTTNGNFTITNEPTAVLIISKAELKVPDSLSKVTENNEEQWPEELATIVGKRGEVLELDTDYTLAYNGNTQLPSAVGVYAVTITLLADSELANNYILPANYAIPFEIVAKQIIEINYSDTLEINYSGEAVSDLSQFGQDELLKFFTFTTDDGTTLSLSGGTDYTVVITTMYNGDVYYGAATADTTGMSTASGTIVGSTYYAVISLTLANTSEYYAGYVFAFDTITVLLKYKTVQFGLWFYTIEDALNAASSGTVTVKADASFTALSNIYNGTSYYTVNSGVTLLLPYDGVSGVNTTNRYYSASDIATYKIKRVEMIVPDGLVITNNGTIQIGGITTGGNGGGANAGATTGDYAQITLGANARIESYGNVDAYGFIMEETKNNGSEVIMHSGTLLMPFVVTEHRGGTKFSTMLRNGKLEVSPFNRFYVENVTATVKIESYASVIGQANLYASSSDHKDKITLVGIADDSMIQLVSGSYVVAKYDIDTKVIDLNVYGSMKLNALSISITILLQNISLNTSDVLFPISWHFNITLNALNGSTVVDATGQDIKIMWGASITVNKGVTLNANKIIAYSEDFDDAIDSTGAVAASKYETGKGAGVLHVNGTLNVNSIGGRVTSNTDGAIINVSSGVSVESKELKNADTYATYSVTEPLVLDGIDSAQISTGIYEFASGKWQACENVQQITYTIKYHLNNEVEEWSPVTYTVYLLSGTTSYTITRITEPAPEMLYYEFTGWYPEYGTQISPENPLIVTDGDVIDIYAGWKPAEYKIMYMLFNYGTGSLDTVIEGDVWSYGEQVTLLNDLAGEGTIFSGWYRGYKDGNFLGEKISELSNTVAENNTLAILNGYIIFFGYIYSEPIKVTYDITSNADILTSEYIEQFKTPPTDHTVILGNTIGNVANDLGLDYYDYDVTMQYYFEGWYANNKPVTATTVIDTTYLTSGGLVLVARWAEKPTLTLKGGQVTGQRTVNYGFKATLNIRDGSYATSNNVIESGENSSNSGYVKPETTIAVTSYSTSSDFGNVDSITIKGSGGLSGITNYDVRNESASVVMSSTDATIETNSTTGCLVEGALILMADGTQKKVEDLMPGDQVLIFNHETGMYEAGTLWINVHENQEAELYRVLNLQFSNGTTLRIVERHGIFDRTLQQYVFIGEYNYHEFIGHEFSSVQLVNGEYVDVKVTLDSAYITEEVVRIFSPMSMYHFDLVAENMLTVTPLPGMNNPFVNLFDYDDEMRYDVEQIARELEMFGMLTAEECKALVGIDELYYATPIKYLKVGLAKGLFVMDDVYWIINYICENGYVN